MKFKRMDVDTAAVVTLEAVSWTPRDREAMLSLMESAGESKLPCVVLNMKNVDHMYSTGISILVAAQVRLQRYGGTIKLCEVTPRVRRLLEMTLLHRVFGVFETEKEALEDCREGAAASS
jgi:anti-anti-sigma factor